MPEPVSINGGAIWAVLDQERQARGLSWRQVAAEADVSPSTLSRIAQGHTPTIEGLVRLADWAGSTVDELIGRGGHQLTSEQTPPAAISSYLRTRKELDARGVEALEAIIQAAYEKLRSDPET